MKSRAFLLFVLLVVVATVFVTREVRRRKGPRVPEGGSPPEAGELPRIEAMTELQSVANRIRAAWRRSGAPPVSMRGLPPDEDDPPAGGNSPAGLDPPLDLWGHPYLLERSESEGRVVLSLVSLGSDGARRGTGNAQDLWMEIEAPE